MDDKRIKDVCDQLSASGTGAAKLPAVAGVLKEHSGKNKDGLTKELRRAGLGSGTIDKVFNALK